MKTICVYCGSSPGRTHTYSEGVRALARALANRGLRLVYGGARVGTMGLLADTVLQLGGEVTGVIPRSLLKKDVAHTGLSELRVTESMHARKTLMSELSDGFVALPGGIGTIEELFEIWTWGQLGFHRKPCGLLNVGGYFDHLIAFLEHATSEQFLKRVHRSMLIVESDPEKLLAEFDGYEPPTAQKWVDEPPPRQPPREVGPTARGAASSVDAAGNSSRE